MFFFERSTCVWRFLTFFLAASILWIFCADSTRGDVVTLKNGLQLEGRLGNAEGVGINPLNPGRATPGPVPVKKVVVVDDDLRRYFVSTNQLAAPPFVGGGPAPVQIKIQQNVAKRGRRIASVGAILRVTPWDEYGRRILTMQTPRRTEDIIQAITLVTPTYCKVEGHQGANAIVWDMRIATSSLRRETLSKILKRQVDPNNSSERLKIVKLYIQAERYEEAQDELEEVIADFPKLRALEEHIKQLRQSSARRLLREIELRRDAGQHQLAINMLSNFPTDGVAGETLLRVKDSLDEYTEIDQQRERVIGLLEGHLAQIADEGILATANVICKEIKLRLNSDTLERMADYLRLADDASLSAEQKIALAVSGWLLGSGSGSEKLDVALDLIKVRSLVDQFLNSILEHERDEILKQLEMLEGGQPSYLAKIVAQMAPPVATRRPQEGIPGMVQLQVPGLTGEPDITYHVQLPPEYHSLRRYPCIVTLNGAGTTPQQQIDWWAGSYDEGEQIRLGQATRRGYIVVAPQWSRENQVAYDYSASEHAAVLYSLRDACRRFSIDTDRVFLSGHSMGGDAAWDIGLAHPDLWAGVMPVVATADKYVSRYFENARNRLPMYFVGGEMDGDRMQRNRSDLNKYFRYAGYDVVVAEFQGRGHEHFHDEIQHLFEWTQLHRRDFFPREFEVVSMRPWDNYFWWLELSEYPKNTMVVPLEWPRKGARVAGTEARILNGNAIQVKTAADRVTVWLSPEIIRFDQRVKITVERRKVNQEIQPSASVLLNDLRTRGDRQHPFWAKVEVK